MLVEAQTEAVRIVAAARDAAQQITEQETLHARILGRADHPPRARCCRAGARAR